MFNKIMLILGLISLFYGILLMFNIIPISMSPLSQGLNYLTIGILFIGSYIS